MKTVGIIGGLGPETTAEFYLRIIELTCQQFDKARPPVLIHSIPLPYQVEENLILHGRGEAEYLPFMIKAAQHLEAGGADFIVIPCNSVHVLIEQVRQSVTIPVLSIIDETAYFVKTRQLNQVGILATSFTVSKKLYTSSLESVHCRVTYLPQDDQTLLSQIIDRLVLRKETMDDQQKLEQMIRSFSDKNIKTVLLACTDLQLLIHEISGMTIVDTMEILAQATVRELLS